MNGAPYDNNNENEGMSLLLDPAVSLSSADVVEPTAAVARLPASEETSHVTQQPQQQEEDYYSSSSDTDDHDDDPGSEAAQISVKKKQKKRSHHHKKHHRSSHPADDEEDLLLLLSAGKKRQKLEERADEGGHQDPINPEEARIQKRRERRTTKKYQSYYERDRSIAEHHVWPEWTALLRARPKNQESQAMAAWLMQVVQVSEKQFQHFPADLRGQTVHLRRNRTNSGDQEEEGNSSDQQVSDISDPTCYHTHKSKHKAVSTD
eukprot:CAMPEP_0176122264 /NCGR_PEP_ID=MMETSP0120_2-20121206/61576_1 /TAXON_ID=160619 /ORGANISM="Kryptoperidinium foliaceum, Strain CCMP 1326" /LENGTH=262 /DNA_ID=CAMNT_0017456885 /DNA_START=145 /DNA_END=931 /DNA_ORIENTATION=+